MENVDLSQLGLGITVPFVGTDWECYRPPSWPPPRDWPWVTDKFGTVISRYGDPILDLSSWTNKRSIINFGDGRKLRSTSVVIDPANADLLRLLVAWRGWGERSVKAVRTLMTVAEHFKTLITVCSQCGILASDLSRFPGVIEKVAKALTASTYSHAIGEFERARDARDLLGFELLSKEALTRLKELQPDHDPEQAEYIPTRIWTYIVNRVAEVMKDYADNQDAIEACLTFCVSAYRRNHRPEKNRSIPPFTTKRGRVCELPHASFLGPFELTAEKFGVKNIVKKWVRDDDKKKLGISDFSKYLSLVQHAALVDIMAFTLMRRDEATFLRWNCLSWHDDPVFGRIPLIQGETTKTDPDDTALWIASPSVEPSISALQSIAKVQLSAIGLWSDGDNPVLQTSALMPWNQSIKNGNSKSLARGRVRSLSELVMKDYHLLFNPQQLTITEDDLKIALAVSPTLNRERFQVGKPWIPAWHQLRRTGAVNMFASGDISDSSVQLQMKHLTRAQPLYYGRGNTALHLNNDVRVLLVNAQYEATGRELAAMQTDRFISPHGDTHKLRLLAPANDGCPVDLISESDAKHYEKVFREHRIGGRLTVLGACMNNGQCDGDCVSSVGDCSGGDGKAACAFVLLDLTRRAPNQKRLEAVRLDLVQTPPNTPRHRYLQQEERGLENYFVYINKAA